jgi:hypothetical protein
LFVAAVLALATVLIGAAFLLPWFEGIHLAPTEWHFTAFVLVLLVGAGVGYFVLYGAITDAMNRRAVASSFCVTKLSADIQRELIAVGTRINEDDIELTRLKHEIAAAANANPVDSTKLDDLRTRLYAINEDFKASRFYERQLVDLEKPADARSLSSIYASFGC